MSLNYDVISGLNPVQILPKISEEKRSERVTDAILNRFGTVGSSVGTGTVDTGTVGTGTTSRTRMETMRQIHLIRSEAAANILQPLPLNLHAAAVACGLAGGFAVLAVVLVMIYLLTVFSSIFRPKYGL
mmetsp:Transcript_31416/g.62241  ORF Transcript_31416/g.62241 Transcript_31416/m.62241 type:complete len:129 (-) Transcript_31416:141-527(-)